MAIYPSDAGHGTEPLVSVIVPVYQVEDYLDRCVTSIVGQTYRALEIILIDDGSPDRCPALCDVWAQRDTRIRVVHKQNEGLGFARNSGLSVAQGKYVCFVDSDDDIEPDMVHNLVSRAEETGSDLVLFGFRRLSPMDEVLEIYAPKPPKGFFSGEEVLTCVLPRMLWPAGTDGEDWQLNWSSWSSFYRMDVIRRTGWGFVSEREIISEDVYSLISLYASLQSVAISEDALYNYRENGSSLTRHFRRDRLSQVKDFYLRSLELVKGLGYPRVVEESLSYPYLIFSIAALKQLVASDESFFYKRAEFARLCRDTEFRDAAARCMVSAPSKRRLFIKALLNRAVLGAMVLAYLQSRVR